VLSCRTAALGGFALECDQCRDPVRLYHACRDRHCPRCQRRASEAWCERERAAVLPVTYHHLVFTLPHTLNGWVALYPREFYGLVFETVWATLAAFAADPKRLGGQLGMTAVLHTWGQALTRHVHLHCLLPGGAFAADGRWRFARSTYLFPVRALSRHFRGGFVSRLRQAVEQGRLPRLDPAQIGPVLDELMRVEWNVYTKPCLGHTETVVNYLGRYTHRIGLSDQRLRALDEGQVQLDYQDHRDGRRAQNNDAVGRGTHPPLLAPRAAERLHARAPLRLPRQSLPRRAAQRHPAGHRRRGANSKGHGRSPRRGVAVRWLPMPEVPSGPTAHRRRACPSAA
jgi:hypothetical protein